ncbi:hypothetical protein vBKpPFBKp16_015 [Klebsiella phage vB_KpP_FBKp16]|uniref:Uncharacterized protein n=1 Tax=Klebsiella phage vB_KpP_FBKp16 TaxID=2801836 RepID=A0A7U0GAP9_9CAUD|nr:hypothetical protein vBKpPFBKp16_015 [Klebsiella phage vB_KpP_FBKp16]
MTVLKLHVGDRVRNINKMSKRRGCQGVVHDISYHASPKLGAREYHVVYDNGMMQSYAANSAHFYLELVVNEVPQSKLDYGTAYRDASMMTPEGRSTMLRAICDVSGLQRPGKRKVLRRERVNVITGKTQSEMVRELGPARGVEQFNTRATGRSTGIAYHIVGLAMCSPGKAISYRNADHVFNEGTSTPHRSNDNFFHTILDVIGKKSGFTCNRQDCTITFNPIVTEEVYVE